jgi:hypothetical protein
MLVWFELEIEKTNIVGEADNVQIAKYKSSAILICRALAAVARPSSTRGLEQDHGSET